MPQSSVTIEDLQQRLKAFVTEREWDPFHSPRNLVMGLCGEAGVQIYLLLLVRKLDIDLLAATADKIKFGVRARSQ